MSNPREDAVHLLDDALQECLSDYLHPDEFGGYDTDSREAAAVAVDALLANPALLAGLVGYAERLDPIRRHLATLTEDP